LSQDIILKKRDWTFITNHGRVLAYIAKYSQSTTEDIAREVNITIRMVQIIISDLDMAGYITRKKQGRGNTYTINAELPMRHPMERDCVIGDVLQVLGCRRQ
jgi:predicted transcriptional regulator